MEVTFVTARSCVVPKIQQSIPHLELCAAPTGGQVGNGPKGRVNVTTQQCHYMVRLHYSTDLAFNRFLLFQGLCGEQGCRDMRAKGIWHVAVCAVQRQPSCGNYKRKATLWSQQREQMKPRSTIPLSDTRQLARNATIFPCKSRQWTKKDSPLWPVGLWSVTAKSSGIPPVHRLFKGPYSTITWQLPLTVEDYKNQAKSFLKELSHLRSGKPLPSNSKLLCLAPELDNSTNLILVREHLRQISPLKGGCHKLQL